MLTLCNYEKKLRWTEHYHSKISCHTQCNEKFLKIHIEVTRVRCKIVHHKLWQQKTFQVYFGFLKYLPLMGDLEQRMMSSPINAIYIRCHEILCRFPSTTQFCLHIFAAKIVYHINSTYK